MKARHLVMLSLGVFSRPLTNLPLVVYPNSGAQYDAVTKTWSSTHDAACSLTAYLPEWQAVGARLIGGCCRTTPADIADIARCCQH